MSDNSPSSPDESTSRLFALLVCGGAVGACLAYAYWRSDLPTWWRNYGGGIPYVVFWVTFWFAVFPRPRWILAICLAATAATCGLEVLQLWKPDWLQSFRATRFGAALIGSGFAWQDFPPYFLGGVLGYLILRQLSRFHRVRSYHR